MPSSTGLVPERTCPITLILEPCARAGVRLSDQRNMRSTNLTIGHQRSSGWYFAGFMLMGTVPISTLPAMTVMLPICSGLM